jgi:RHS repeat-associated protein
LSKTIKYIYDGNNCIAENDGTNKTQRLFSDRIDDLLLETTNNTNAYFPIKDLLGSTKLILDNQERVIDSISYDPHGTVTSGNILETTFTGRPFDKDIKLINLRSRWYDPMLTRFINEDTIGISGGLNLYTYALNNPTNYIDPYGEKPKWINLPPIFRKVPKNLKKECTKNPLACAADGSDVSDIFDDEPGNPKEPTDPVPPVTPDSPPLSDRPCGFWMSSYQDTKNFCEKMMNHCPSQIKMKYNEVSCSFECSCQVSCR